MNGAPMKRETSTRATDEPWLDLVISMLAVNNASLEKTYQLGESFRQHGLVNPSNLASWDQSKIAAKMKAAGFNRGDFMTTLFSVRLSALGQCVKATGLEESTKVISGRDRKAIEKLLGPVHGVGQATPIARSRVAISSRKRLKAIGVIGSPGPVRERRFRCDA